VEPRTLLLVDAPPEDLRAFRRGLPAWEILGLRRKLDWGTGSGSKIGDPARIEVLATTVPISEADLAALPGLRLVCACSTGTNHIDVEAARRRGIAVCNAPAAGSSVAEHAFALLLAAARRIGPAIRTLSRGSYSHDGLLGFELEGKTLGILGTGRIGIRVARIGIGFGMQVIASDPRPQPDAAADVGFRYVDWDTLLRRSDALILSCPLGEATFHIVDACALAKMKRGAILVNVARGPVVDTEALLASLEQGQLGAAGLDVLEGETAIGGAVLNPIGIRDADAVRQMAVNGALIRHPAVVATPHVGYYTSESLRRVRELLIENVIAFGRGAMQNLV
jgi:D-lactate dehydrogenase